MKFEELRTAVDNAEYTLTQADNVANDIAKMLKGRLRKVNPYVLSKLKSELKEFNSKTKSWNE